MYRTKCNTQNLVAFEETEPTACPVDDCGDFTSSLDQ